MTIYNNLEVRTDDILDGSNECCLFNQFSDLFSLYHHIEYIPNNNNLSFRLDHLYLFIVFTIKKNISQVCIGCALTALFDEFIVQL